MVKYGARGVVPGLRTFGILLLAISLFPVSIAAVAAQGDDGATPQASPRTSVATPDNARASPAAERGVYESPLYGYSLEYDAAVWKVLMEDPSPDDDYDQLFLANGVSVVTLIGDPDFAEDEMSDCVSTYAAHLETRETNQNIAPLDEPDAAGDEDGRAWATYSYDYVPTGEEPTPFIRYIECTYLGDGVTLVVIHDAEAGDYADEIEAREALLDGLDV